jgi:hypothetical protein
MPRTDPLDKDRFDLLKRGYVEARYSKSYRISSQDLGVLRSHALDLAERVRQACGDKLVTFMGPKAVSELPPVPRPVSTEEFPPPPRIGSGRKVVFAACRIQTYI